MSNVSVVFCFLIYQCGFWYIIGSWRRGISHRLPVLPLHITVWYTYGLTCDQVVHPIIYVEKKGGEPHVFCLYCIQYNHNIVAYDSGT